VSTVSTRHRPAHVVEHVVSKRDRGTVFEDDAVTVTVTLVASSFAMATASSERGEPGGERARRCHRPKASAARTQETKSAEE